MLISDAYRQENINIHDKSFHWGVIGDGDIALVRQLVAQHQCQSILDYGCGKGRLGKVLPNVQSYDPGVPQFADPPRPADLVVCTSVLEHVEPESLTEVLANLREMTMKAVMLMISFDASSYVLSDGRNAHLIQELWMWWLPKLSLWNLRTLAVGRRDFTFVGVV